MRTRPKKIDLYITGGKFNYICILYISKKVKDFEGVHLTRSSNVVTNMLKHVTCTECSGEADIKIWSNMSLDDINQEQQDLYNFVGSETWLERCDNVTSITDMSRYVPWFLECNQNRYPYWFGNPEARNKYLFEALNSYFSSNFR